MTISRPSPSLTLDLLQDLVPALLRAALVVAVAVALWHSLGTLDPDSADIGGLPIGALVGGTAGAVVAAIDTWRRTPRAAVRLWGLVLVVCWLAVTVFAVVRNGLDPFAPVAGLVVVVLMAVPVGVVLGVVRAIRT